MLADELEQLVSIVQGTLRTMRLRKKPGRLC